ncbi:hypothetical protein CcCBS67573_g05856 [Chytriomyces confervae]|uniref:Uncharacterized protein n=1 Tax=Chytriomyces confervae TaxID=246404 RepID=A0A507FAW0_9FUNG|nr:hypothetical protein CcCBS67573_g05856 [Chytriomyces confervae]
MEFVLASLASKCASVLPLVASLPEAALMISEMESMCKYLNVLAQRQKERTEKMIDEFEDLRKEYVDAYAGQRMLRWQLEAIMASSEDTRNSISELQLEKQALQERVEELAARNTQLERPTRNELDMPLTPTQETCEVASIDTRIRSCFETNRLESDSNSLNLAQIQHQMRPPSFVHDEVEFKLLKSQVSERDARIAQLEYAAHKMEATTKDSLLRLQDTQKDTMLFRTAIYDIEQENSRLREEMKSYQLLLERRTTTGNFLSTSALIQNTVDEPVLNFNDEMNPETAEVHRLQSELKALTLYIEKVLLKAIETPQFQAAVVKNEDEPERARAAKTRPSSVIGFSSFTNKSQNRISYLSQLPLSAASAAIDLYRGVGKRSSAPAAPSRRLSVPPETLARSGETGEFVESVEASSGTVIGFVGKVMGSSRLVSSTSMNEDEKEGVFHEGGNDEK